MTLKETIQENGQRHLYVKSAITLEIPYNEIPCNEASLLRARHASL